MDVDPDKLEVQPTFECDEEDNEISDKKCQEIIDSRSRIESIRDSRRRTKIGSISAKRKTQIISTLSTVNFDFSAAFSWKFLLPILFEMLKPVVLVSIPSCRPAIEENIYNSDTFDDGEYQIDLKCGGIKRYTYFISILGVLWMNCTLCEELWHSLVTHEDDEYADHLRIPPCRIWAVRFLSSMTAFVIEIVIYYVSGDFFFPFNGVFALLGGGMVCMGGFCGLGIYQWWGTEECVDKDVAKYRIALFFCLLNLGLMAVFVYVLYNTGFQLLLIDNPTSWYFYGYSTVVLFVLRKSINFVFTKLYFLLNQSDNIAIGFMFNFIVHCSFLAFMRGASADVNPMSMLLMSLSEVATLIFSFASLLTNKFTYLPWKKKKETDMTYSEIFSHDDSMYSKVQYLGMEEMIELIMSINYGFLVCCLMTIKHFDLVYPMVCGVQITCFGYTGIGDFWRTFGVLMLTLIFEIFCGYIMHLALNKYCKINILAMLFWMFHTRNNAVFRAFLSTTTSFTLVTYFKPFCIDATMNFFWRS